MNLINNFKITTILLIAVFIGLISFSSCEKENSTNEITDKPEYPNIRQTKEFITIDNIGEAHNYLLSELEKNPSLRNDNKTLFDIINDMKVILEKSEIYSNKSVINTGLPTHPDRIYEAFGDIELNADFFEVFKSRFRDYIKNNQYLDKEVANEILISLENYSEINTESLNENMIGFPSVTSSNNVYKSSLIYWNNYGISFNRSVNAEPSDRGIIWADAAGAVLGATCSWGLMSVLMAAAASDAYIRCVELAEEIDNNKN